MADLFNPPASAIVQMAAYPGHYDRSGVWALPVPYTTAANRRTLVSPSRISVNIGPAGYVLPASVAINLASPDVWDSRDPVDYTIAANRAGKNLYMYACTQAGTVPRIVLSANSTMPAGYTADTSRKTGGFHCLCMSVGAIAGHALDGFVTGDILPASIWDLMHRPRGASPEGMVYAAAFGIWVDIYLASGTGVGTASIFKGTITYNRTWMDFADTDGPAIGKRLLHDAEFAVVAAGSNERTSIPARPGTTGGHNDKAGRRMISNIGCEDCCGALWQWLDEQSYRYNANTHSHTENATAVYTQNAATGDASSVPGGFRVYYPSRRQRIDTDPRHNRRCKAIRWGSLGGGQGSGLAVSQFTGFSLDRGAAYRCALRGRPAIGDRMKNFPQWFNTRQDVENCLAMYPNEMKARIAAWLDGRFSWQAAARLENEAQGIIDETHKVEILDDGTIWQLEYIEDPNNHLARLGITVDEAEALTRGA